MKASVQPKRNRDFEMLYGLHPVHAALKQEKRQFMRLYHNPNRQENELLSEIIALARDQGIPISETTQSQMKLDLAHDAHQGIALRCSPLPELSWHAFRESGRSSLNALVALDQVEDPQNLGAVIRSCGFFRIKALVIPRKHSCPVTPGVSKASSGVAEWYPVITVNNLTRFLEQRKKEGYWAVRLDVEEDQKIHELELDRQMILVLGSESRGLRPLIRKTCDWLVSIDGDEKVESLNVSNAAAIALHRLSVSAAGVSDAGGL